MTSYKYERQSAQERARRVFESGEMSRDPFSEYVEGMLWGMQCERAISEAKMADEFSPCTREHVTYGVETLNKTYDVLKSRGYDTIEATRIVNDLLNAGLLIRERAE